MTQKRRLVLRLFVAGDSPNSVLARTNLEAAIAHVRDQVTLEIVDVLTVPERAMADGVLVTPTLVKVAPLPERRIIGNLHDHLLLLPLLAGLTATAATR